ncbi:MAG: hypothetical protein AAGB29_04915 [Planctomycetota bacterium]
MTPPTPEPDRPTITREMVRGFVDGELPREEHEAVLDALMSDPAVAELVQTERKLRHTLAGCMDCQITMRCPDALKARLAEICDESADDTPMPTTDEAGNEQTSPAVIGQVGGGGWGRSALAFAAMFIAAAVLVAVVMNSRGVGADRFLPGPDAAVLPAGLPMDFAKRHVLCATGVIDLMKPEAVPEDSDLLKADLAARFGSSPESMDLSSLGYRIGDTGICYVPGVGAVHTVFVADSNDRSDSVSVWVIGHDPERALKLGKLYEVIDNKHPHPMVMWTDGKLDYYVVGDDYDAVSAVPAILDPDSVSRVGEHGAVAVNY